MSTRFTFFDAPVGRCLIAWRGSRIVALQLPEARDERARERLLARFPDASESTPSAAARRAMKSIVAMLRGEASDLSAIALDMEGTPPFHQRVYEAARTLPPGTTVTYGELAARLGSPGSARAVGQALGRNPFPIVVPCHRVLAAGGRLGGFSATGGLATKLRLLALERAHAQGELPLFDGDGSYAFDVATALGTLRRADPALVPVMDAIGPFRLRLKRATSVFEALAESIVYQQLTGRAAATIHARVCALFPDPHEGLKAEHVARASDAKLLGAGLSRAKMLSLRDLAERTLSGELPDVAELHGMADDEIVERLTVVRGIGRWTVEMLLMFRLGRPDVLPLDDLGVRKGFGIMLGSAALPSKAALQEHGERWRPYRSVASWYMWRATELPAD